MFTLYKIFFSCCFVFKKIIHLGFSKSLWFWSLFQSKFALIRVYIYNFIFFYSLFIQLVLLVILQLIFISIFKIPIAECEGSFLGNMIIVNEKTGYVEIWIHGVNTNNITSIVNNPINPGPLFFPVKDPFNPVVEVNTMFDRYLDILNNPNSRKGAIECIIDSLPAIETSSIFSDPLNHSLSIKTNGHSYLVLKELYNLSYLNPALRLELLNYITVYNFYVDCAKHNLSSIQAATFIEQMPMDDYMLEYNKVKSNMYTYITIRRSG